MRRRRKENEKEKERKGGVEGGVWREGRRGKERREEGEAGEVRSAFAIAGLPARTWKSPATTSVKRGSPYAEFLSHGRAAFDMY